MYSGERIGFDLDTEEGPAVSNADSRGQHGHSFRHL